MQQKSQSDFSDRERHNSERRLVGRALKFWENAREGRKLPSASDLDIGDRPFADDDVMIIDVGANEFEDRVTSAGTNITAALGRDPTGLNATDALPSSTEMGLSFCRASIDLKKPMADVGQFFNRNGDEVLYRSILLPVSDDGEQVNRVVLAFSSKVVN